MDNFVLAVAAMSNRKKLAWLVTAIALLCIVFYFPVFKPLYEKYQEAMQQNSDLQKELAAKRDLAKHLPQARKEYDAVKEKLDGALQQLPNQKEIPALLTGIAATGRHAGLEVLLFRPKPEELRDFYASIPVDLAVSGSFFDLIAFFREVASMPRIVNIGNVSITDVKDTPARTTVKASCLATTFRFVDSAEVKNAPQKTK